jgi:hypothetical protein
MFKPLLEFAKFFVKTYGIFLKFFLQLNGGYWGKIGIGQYSKIERKRLFFILPFYILLALLFGFLSVIYWYYVVLFIPLLISRYLIDTAQWNNTFSFLMAFAIIFGWLLILSKTK